MARINTTPRSEKYTALNDVSTAMGENNDCSVIALAAVTGKPYTTARAALAEQGRRPGRGVSIDQIHAALKSLGFRAERIDLQERIARYPGAHAALKNVTTHHPDRFPAVWAEGTFLFYTRRHVAAVVDSVNHDWTRGRAQRVRAVYLITPLED